MALAMHMGEEWEALNAIENRDILKDLQRCRRLVVCMRGLVLTTSLHEKLLAEIVAAVARKQSPKYLADPMNSPRTRYVRDWRTERIRTIQRRWKKVRIQRLILAHIDQERKWGEYRGVRRYEQSALLIQRVYRGFVVRQKRKLNTLFDVIVATHQMSKLERLRADRFAFHKQMYDDREELIRVKHELQKVEQEKAKTEHTIASSKKNVVFIDAKMLDGTVVRMEAHQLLLHQLNEHEKLVKLCKELELRVMEHHKKAPVVHHAATRIQSQFHKYKYNKRKKAQREYKLNRLLRMMDSREACYKRMNEGLRQRQERLWRDSAGTITSCYSIIQAKKVLYRYKHERAGNRIAAICLKKYERKRARAELEGLRKQHKAKVFLSGLLQRHSHQVWISWRLYVESEKERKRRIAVRVQLGQERWVSKNATRVQRMCHVVLARRARVAQALTPLFDPVIVHHATYSARHGGNAHSSCALFFGRIASELNSWRAPSKHDYVLAKQFGIELPKCPVARLQHWWTHEIQGQFFDIRQPFLVRTMELLVILSDAFRVHCRIVLQLDQMVLIREERMLARHYLMVLYAHNQVAFTETMTYTWGRRQRAIELLIQMDRDEAISTMAMDASGAPLRDPFTTFHCLLHDLCESCLALQEKTGTHQRVCPSCGLRSFEKSTHVEATYLLGPQDPSANPVRNQSSSRWFNSDERCDFLVVNAYFHALAPLGHEHRDKFTAEQLWAIAMTQAFPIVQSLYQDHGVTTLDELMHACCPEQYDAPDPPWAAQLPAQVFAKMKNVAILMKDVLERVNAAMRITNDDVSLVH